MTGRVTFAGVTKRYRSTPGAAEPVVAVHDVSVTIGPDEAVGLIGPNGAGKSTLLKLAAGVTTPTTGRITRTGHTLAVIELGAGLHPDLTGRENIDLLTTIALGTRARSTARFDEIVAFSELAHALDEPVRKYSSGMVARLAFSVATCCEPELLLIDEVLSVGDLEFQRRCRERILELRSQGTTIVVVSHDLGLIGAICDRALLVNAGRIELDGEADDVIDSYLGRPARPKDAGALHVDLAATTRQCGQTVDARFAVPADVPVARARIEYVVATHEPLQEEQGLSIVCGETTIERPPPGPLSVALTTAGLPPGRYELRVSLEGDERRATHAAIARFTLVGPPGPVAIRLIPRTTLDGQPLEAAAP